MSEHHDDHGHDDHGGHGGASVGQWLEQHMSGLIVPFGARIEAVFEETMFLFVNGIFLKIARVCVIVMTPVLLVEFMLHAVRF